MSEFHLREPAEAVNPSPRVKPQPKTSRISSPFFYAASDDGTDENLLILLHGLGDTHIPFSKLGRQLKLPQTAVLALRAPEQISFLYEDAYQWYTSFDSLGEQIERPNPTPALQFLDQVVEHLVGECAWPLGRIHLFGFAQGGSVAAEFGIAKWKEGVLRLRGGSREDALTESAPVPALASIVNVSGPLLSYPTLSSLCPTPLLAVHRPPPAATDVLPSSSLDLNALKKAYQNVTESKMGKGQGMPSSKEDWEPIMRFWSQHLARRQIEGLYEVMTGS